MNPSLQTSKIKKSYTKKNQSNDLTDCTKNLTKKHVQATQKVYQKITNNPDTSVYSKRYLHLKTKE